MMKVTFKITNTKVAPPIAPPTIAPVFPALTGIVVVIASSVCWGGVVDIVFVVSVVAVIYVDKYVCICTENSVHIIVSVYRGLKVSHAVIKTQVF